MRTRPGTTCSCARGPNNSSASWFDLSPELDGDNLVWRIRHVDCAAGDCCGVEIFFEHVAEVGVCEARGRFDARGAAGAVAFVEADDQGVAIFGFFDGVDD